MALSLNHQRLFYAGIIIVLLSVIITSLYYLMGGFKEVEVLHLVGDKKNVVGKYFIGYYAHPDLEEQLIKSRRLVESGALAGNLTVINFQNDSLDNDEVEQFIGISLDGGMAEVPSGYEVLEVDMKEKLSIFLSMHPFVRPRPKTIERMFDEFAEVNQLTMDNFTLETHYLDNSMSVEMVIVQH